MRLVRPVAMTNANIPRQNLYRKNKEINITLN